MGARLLRSLIRFAADSINPIELELDRMILNISLLNRAKLFRSHSKGRYGGAPLQFTNRFTDYYSDAIEMKLGRMILGISPQNRSESNSPGFPQGHCWGAPFQISNRFTTYSIYPFDFVLDIFNMIVQQVMDLHNRY